MLRTVSAYRRYFKAKKDWKRATPEKIIVGTDHVDNTFGAVCRTLNLLVSVGHNRVGIELPSNYSLSDWVMLGGFFGPLAIEATKRGIGVIPIDVPFVPIETELKFDSWYHALAIVDKHKGNIEKAREEIKFNMRKLRFLLERLGDSEQTEDIQVKLSRLLVVARILEEGNVQSIEQRVGELNREREEHMERRIRDEELRAAISGEGHALALKNRLPKYGYLFI